MNKNDIDLNKLTQEHLSFEETAKLAANLNSVKRAQEAMDNQNPFITKLSIIVCLGCLAAWVLFCIFR